jgi:hypothetical protein
MIEQLRLIFVVEGTIDEWSSTGFRDSFVPNFFG